MAASVARSGPLAHLSRDEVFDLLSNRRRRCVVHYLRQRGCVVELSELAQRVAAWENGVDVRELTAAQRKRVYTSLQQTHLDKLDDAGIVEYDADRGVVAPTPAMEELEVYLEVVSGREFPWREYYLALGAVSAALVVVGWRDLGPFALAPDALWGGLVAGVLLVSAALHVVAERGMRIGGGDADVPPDLDD